MNNKMHDLLTALYGQKTTPNPLYRHELDSYRYNKQSTPITNNSQKPSQLIVEVNAHPENIVDAEFEVIKDGM